MDWKSSPQWLSLLYCWAHRTATTPTALFTPLLRNLCGAVVGNLGMSHMIGLSSHLHCHAISSSVVLHQFLSFHCHYPQNTLMNFWQKNIISYLNVWHSSISFSFLLLQSVLYLAVMAYDRYVAITNHLLYNMPCLITSASSSQWEFIF